MSDGAKTASPETAIPNVEDNPRKKAWETRRKLAAEKAKAPETAPAAPRPPSKKARAKTPPKKAEPSAIDVYAERLELRLSVAAALVELTAEERAEVLAAVCIKE